MLVKEAPGDKAVAIMDNGNAIDSAAIDHNENHGGQWTGKQNSMGHMVHRPSSIVSGS